MSVLLYLASGQYQPFYENINYDQVILVDRKLNIKHLTQPSISKVELIKDDALTALRTLKSRPRFKVDCLVSINEGLIQGGGDYPILNELLLGYLHPMLADEFVLIANFSYYGAVRMSKRVARLDWGFISQRLTVNHPKFIDPKIFTTYGNPKAEKFGDVLLLKRSRSSTEIFINPLVKISVVHGSIWEDEHELDCIGLNIRPAVSKGREKVTRFFLKFRKVFSINGKTIEEILEYAEENKSKRIGLTPWMKGDYIHVIEVLKNYKSKHLKEITFYHLSKSDYKIFYDLSKIIINKND